MKRRSKVLATVLCAVMLVVASVMGTLAYLTDSETVTNTFTVGNVYIELAENVDYDGNEIGEDAVEGVVPTADDKFHLQPGLSYTKEPIVTVLEDSENAYIRVMATISYAEAADAVFAKYDENKDMSAWLAIDKTAWTLNGIPTTTKENGKISRTYEFRYNDVVAKNSDDDTVLTTAPFDTLMIPGGVTNAELALLADMEIVVTAHAIQADGFENADAAWAAFPATGAESDPPTT